jgi:23S rRNA (uracil1939-C5)-methyltransferase
VKPESDAVSIVRLGAGGDGIADTAWGPCYVPFALPGESVRRRVEGLPELLSAPSPQRQQPRCRHFGSCGGCLAQHMTQDLYGDWKRGILVAAFRQRGLEADVAPLRGMAAGTRRRAVFTSRRQGGELVFGFHRRRSAEVFAVAECPVLMPAIVAELAGLRAIAAAVAEGEVRLTVLATPVGLDVAVEGAAEAMSARTAAALAGTLSHRAIARLAYNREIIAERVRPELKLGGAAVVPPPGAFVQAVGEAETALIGEVLENAGKSRRVADLFAGLGTFSLALARHAHVLAVDRDASALAALAEAKRKADGLKPILTKVRDLMREPLSAKELEAFDCVVLDPPRAGAPAQARQLARARVLRVIYVSCNPATLARDARTLVDGGFALQRVVPIDQFVYSAHLEAVAVFCRPREAAGGAGRARSGAARKQ